MTARARALCTVAYKARCARPENGHLAFLNSFFPLSLLQSPTAIIDKSQHHQAYKRKVKKNMDRNKSRFRTQPVTFMEIKARERHTCEILVRDASSEHH